MAATSILDDTFLNDDEEENDIDFVPSPTSSDEETPDDSLLFKEKAFAASTHLFQQLRAESLASLKRRDLFPIQHYVLQDDDTRPTPRAFNIDEQIRLHTARYDPTACTERPARSHDFELSLDQTREALANLVASEEVVREKRVRFAGKEFLVLEDVSGKKKRLEEIPRSQELDRLASKVHNAKQVTSMDKSRADWLQDVRGKGDAQELEQHKKTGGFMARKSFLENAASRDPPGRRRRINR